MNLKISDKLTKELLKIAKDCNCINLQETIGYLVVHYKTEVEWKGGKE